MFYAYILASGRNGTLYVGSTDDLSRRIYRHKTKQEKGFTARYGVDQFVWFESFESRSTAFGESDPSRNGGVPGKYF